MISRILNIVEKLDMQRRFTPGPEQVNSSRSNSIKGKKLSLCDPQLTISQHTVDKILGNFVLLTY